MNEQIKQRIAQLNNGEVPNGYKKTEFGIFPCDWVKDKTFGDLFDFYGGLGKSRDELGDEGHAYLHYGDLHRGSFNVVSHAQYEHLPKYDVTLKGSEAYLMEDGDVAFLDASEDLEGTSRSVLIDNPDNEPFIAGLHVIFGKSKNNSLEKWYKQYITATDSVRKQFQRLASGFKVYGVTRKTLPKIQIAYPKSADEQSKIAKILMKWDEAIELYNQYIEKLKQLKSIWLKKMFPKKGERVPEWRFKGFTDAWEQRKFEDLYNYASEGGTPDTNNSFFYKNGDVPFVKIEDTESKYIDSTKSYITQEGLSHSSAWLIPENSVIFTNGATVGNVAINLLPVATKQGILGVIPSKKVVTEFLFYLLSSATFQREVRSRMATGTFATIILKNLNQIPVCIPSDKSEQEEIAGYLSAFDNLITLHQCKVEKIKAQQKVLQKYLLNGIVRV